MWHPRGGLEHLTLTLACDGSVMSPTHSATDELPGPLRCYGLEAEMGFH